jgi:peptide-methionine (R)-S-oxide reductase
MSRQKMKPLRLFLPCMLFVRLSMADDAAATRIRQQIVSTPMTRKVALSDDQWRKVLTPGQFQVLRQAKTEPPYKNLYWNNHEKGIYLCAACGNELFSSDAKFESRTGWPSFFAPLTSDKITETADTSHGMTRDEVRCARCGSHLGHLFNDGPAPTHLRYCLNSLALKLRTTKDH